MDLDAYIAEHDGEWRRLEQLTRTGRLTAEQTDEMLMLYQRASTHLSVVRSRMPDSLLVARLSGLVLAARGAITGSRSLARRHFGRFFTHTFPGAVFTAWRWWAGTSAVFVAIWALLIVYVANNPEVQTQLWTPDQMRDLVDRSFEEYYSEYQNQNFALRVWTNNAQVAALALVGGVLILPTLWVLWQNVLNVGLTGGVMVGHGRGDLFFGLIAPHGLLEMGAVLLAGAVGLRIGWSWIAPAPGRTRSQSLAEAGRSGITVALGLVAVLAVAGLIEGFVTPNLPAIIAIPIGVVALAGFIGYVVARGRVAVAENDFGDLDGDQREALRPR
ncbi:putative membrane protein SpoIIM required for sporulation [Stackebrandtia endophytica]|uniref:Putative membrane protein SpoIIM required for sporulation n=1 Tax=Stackebrandtia endophytica TaxID=1496996 RepID=A0A543AT64_9ACTN|nr:stage II sporulation protein M [Stackebrandtia endophytica]TQL75777.1 putative membrane protein SpoIIM required for sporulation [Stackebrandtia endophytica]